MHADEMILISVDDHIAEPADMFEGHLAAKYRDRAPRVETDAQGLQQWWYGDKRGRNLGLNAVAGKPRECSTSIRQNTPRCAQAVSMCMSGFETCRPAVSSLG